MSQSTVGMKVISGIAAGVAGFPAGVPGTATGTDLAAGADRFVTGHAGDDHPTVVQPKLGTPERRSATGAPRGHAERGMLAVRTLDVGHGL